MTAMSAEVRKRRVRRWKTGPLGVTRMPGGWQRYVLTDVSDLRSVVDAAA